MKLSNRTDAHARILKNASPSGPRAMMGCVIAREVFAIGDDGTLAHQPGEAWPIDPDEVTTPLGTMPGDRPFLLGGVDVLLGGRVFAATAVTTLDVAIEVGRTFRRRIRVLGDRVWERAADGALVPGAPRVFTSMALGYERAFGGTAETDAGPMPCVENPVGRGFHVDAAQAEGAPLPNLEDPTQLLATWQERPVPVGLGYYPQLGGLRPLAALDHPSVKEARARLGLATRDGDPAEPSSARDLTPVLFNQAHPGMVIEAAKAPRAGDVVRVTHGRRGGHDLWFALPDRPLHLHVQLGDREHVVPMHLDQIGVVCGEAKVLLSHRSVFEYTSRPGEPREVTLYRGPVPADIPPGYRRAAQAGWDRDWWDRV